MSLRDPFPAEVPEETAQLVEPLLADDSVYRLVAGCVDEFLSDEQFIKLYANEGRPGINPVILSLVTVFQYLEKLPDRAAAEMAVMRMDWKYALRQPLDWRGFHYSDLCNFRKRLLEHRQESMVFEHLLEYLRERGLVRAGGMQRTDATHILGAVKRLTDVEVVREGVRLAIGELMSTAAGWAVQYLPASFFKSYQHAMPNYRMSKQELEAFIQETGEEARWLLDLIAVCGDVKLQQLPTILQLAQIWDDQYLYVNEPECHYLSTRRGKADVVNRLRTPHDPDATLGVKRDNIWVGYKAHITESLEQPRFVVDVSLSGSAASRDVNDLPDIQQQMIGRKLRPAQHYVDQGYMSGEQIAQSQQRGIDLRGKVMADKQGKPEGFSLADFEVDMDNEQVTCPAGRHPQRWTPTTGNANNQVAIHVFFGKQCLSCPFFGPGRCTTSQTGRHLSLTAYHDEIQARRQEEQTKAFQFEMHRRAGIEGTISELIRAHGLRRARYRGKSKVLFQMLFTATATNLKRLARSQAIHLTFSCRLLAI